MLQEWQITIPTHDNDGQVWLDATLLAWEREICERVGGFTVDPMREGVYRMPSGVLMRERSRVYRIAARRQHAERLAVFARGLFSQDTIYLRDLGTFGGFV